MPTVAADAPLANRYAPGAVEIFNEAERRHFLGADGCALDTNQLPWELMYRLEPELYERLVRGERLHPSIIDWLPPHVSRILEIGAGTGRLTLEIASRSDHLVAVEPAAPLRQRLRTRLTAAGHSHVDIVDGFFDVLPVPERHCDIVISCSAFSPSFVPDPEQCLRVMESRCLVGGLLVLVWPNHIDWLRDRGFSRVVFDGPMRVEYPSLEEAVSLARVFHPHAVATIERLASRFVEYDVLGVNPPRDLCWKVVA